MPAPSRPFTARHVQLCRAALAAVAAGMITFSSDHSASVGLSVFGGFAVATGLVLGLAAVIVYPKGERWPSVLLAVLGILAGMFTSITAWQSDVQFFAIVIAWAALTGIVEVSAGIRRRGGEGARDALTVGILGLVLAVALLVVPVGFAQQYTVEDAGTFTLTGIILGVGMFGGYAAIVAVFLAIAGLTPRAQKAVETDAVIRHADQGGPA